MRFLKIKKLIKKKINKLPLPSKVLFIQVNLKYLRGYVKLTGPKISLNLKMNQIP